MNGKTNGINGIEEKAGDKDSLRFIEKVALKTFLWGGTGSVAIPEGADLMRYESRAVKFFSGKPPENGKNGYFQIPEGLVMYTFRGIRTTEPM